MLVGEQPLDHLARQHAAGVDVELEQLAIGPLLQVELLALEHLEILGEDLALALADLVGQCVIVGPEVARHPQKYQIEVSDSGVMKSTTIDDAFRSAGAS